MCIHTFEYKNLSSHLTFALLSKNQFNNNIFYNLGKVSKNIYNLSIYSTQIFNKFKIELYKNLYYELQNNNELDVSDYINKKLVFYFDLYSLLKLIIIIIIFINIL